MKSRFGHNGWGNEQLGLTTDDGTLRLAAQTAGIDVSPGYSPRAMTAVFVAGGCGGKDYAYVQHLQHMEWATGEKDLLGVASRALTRALDADTSPGAELGIDVVGDQGATRICGLAAAIKVPPPPTQRWTAAVLAIYVPNAFGFPTDRWGAVQDRRTCQYSLDELLSNAFLLIQNLRRTDFTSGGVQQS